MELLRVVDSSDLLHECLLELEDLLRSDLCGDLHQVGRTGRSDVWNSVSAGIYELRDMISEAV